MPDPVAFLRHVLPHTGPYCCHVRRGKARWNSFATSIEELARIELEMSAQGLEVWHACGAVREMRQDSPKTPPRARRYGRTGHNIKAYRALWLDADAGKGKPHATPREAAEAIMGFCPAAGLPVPTLVASGGGCHAWWTLERDLTPAEWLPLAEGLKAACHQHGLAADPARTADRASVMRTPGTVNHKNGATVRCGPLTGPYRLEQFMHLAAQAPTGTELIVPGGVVLGELPSHLIGRNAGNALVAKAEVDEWSDRYATIIANKCAQLKAFRDLRGQLPEPLWFLGLGVITFCVDAQNGYEWSQGHEKYNESETQRRMEQFRELAPTRCVTFEKLNPAPCRACPHYGRIKSPIVLGSRDPVAAVPLEAAKGEDPEESEPAGVEMNGHAFMAPLPQTASATEQARQPAGAAAGNAIFSPLAQLNEKYAVIGDVGGKCLVLGHVPGKVNPAVRVPSFQSFKSFTERYANQYVKVKRENKDGETIEEIKQLGAFWLKWPGRRSYEGIDLVPGAPRELPGGHLNLWTGFGVDPREGGWPLMRQHVAEVLASGDARAAEYIFRFAAWAVQHPGERAEVAMVFRGGKGSGKGAFANALVRIFGQHGLQIYSPKHLTGAFNAHLRSCLLLYADEAFWAGDRQGESTLKGMLTEPALTIEQKGVDVVAWRNRLHVIMAANADWVVPASHDERRFAMFNVSAARRDDRAYFTALHAELDAGGLEAMLHDLLKVQLGDWHPRHVWQTAALAEQKVLSMPALSQWWAQILENGALPNGALRNPDRVQAKVLLCHLHEEYPRAQGTTPDALARFLKQNGCQRVHAREGTMWHFPLLSDARKAWEERFGGWDWENKVSGWWDARHPVTSVSQLST